MGFLEKSITSLDLIHSHELRIQQGKLSIIPLRWRTVKQASSVHTRLQVKVPSNLFAFAFLCHIKLQV